MSLQPLSRKVVNYTMGVISKLVQFAKNIPDLIKEFKSVILILVAWILISESAGYHLTDIFKSVFRLIIYPLNWVVFRTNFDLTEIPVIFILLMPLVVFVTAAFLIIISTED